MPRTRPLPDHTYKVIIAFLAFFAICLALGLLLYAVLPRPSHAEWQNVAGEWEKYRLNNSQMMWFKGVKNKQNVPCCNVADGHPTEMRRTLDGGYQVPDPRPGFAGAWLDVPVTAMTKPPNNPIGVATVWYAIQAETVYIRCFVPESEG